MSLTDAEIKNMKVADLRKQLSDRGVTLRGRSNKSGLVRKLIAAVKAETEAAAEEEVAAEEEPAAEEEAAEEEPAAEEPAAEEPAAEEPAAEEPAAEEPAAEEPAAEEPAAEEPAAEEPAAEKPAFVVVGEPSGPNANDTILAKLSAKAEEDRTDLEKDILAAKARTEKFENEGNAVTISDAHKRLLRAQRFGPVVKYSPKKRSRAVPATESAAKKKPKKEVVIDEEEQKKRDARSSRFAVAEEPAAEEPATEEPATEEPATEEPAAEVTADAS